MWIFLGILMVLGVSWYLVLSRTINPDAYFIKKIDPIPYTRIYVNDYVGSLQIAPNLGDEYKTMSTGNRYYISNIYSLYDDDYSFTIDEDNHFVLKQLSNNKIFVLGKILEKTYLEYNGTDLYTIQLPKDYAAFHHYKRGLLPFYEKVNFTMMSSGGIKYSSEVTTIVISSSGDELRLYQNNGYIPKGKPTGIY